MGNLIKTGFLLVVLTCLLILIGGAVGGRQGMAIAFVLALVMNAGSYWFSDKIVLGMYGAQPMTEAEAPQLYRIVRQLAAEAHIPVPPIYIIQDDSPNAFATGRNPQHAAVAVTAVHSQRLLPACFQPVSSTFLAAAWRTSWAISV